MSEQYTYAVSRIHAKELDLLSLVDLEQILMADGFESAIKLLCEKGYGTRDGYSDFRQLESDEVSKMWSLISELVPNKEPFDTLLRQTDFYNLKAATKSVFTAENSTEYFLQGGTVDPELILESLKLKKYSELPKFMQAAAEQAADEFAKTGDGQECDILIDKLCLETIAKEGKRSGIPIIENYTKLLVALSDIKIAVRCAHTRKSKDFLLRALAECASINVDSLATAASKGIEDVYKYLEHTDYKEAVDMLSVSISEFEKWADNKIMDLIKGEKSNPFTIAPIFAYILAKQTELKAVQIVMTGKKNDIDNNLIRERIRDLYV